MESSVGGTPARLAPLTPSQRRTHDKLLQKIRENDAEEARCHRKAIGSRSVATRALRSGSGASMAVGLSIHSPTRPTTTSTSYKTEFSPASTASTITNDSENRRNLHSRSGALGELSSSRGGRGPVVGEVARLLISANSDPNAFAQPSPADLVPRRRASSLAALGISSSSPDGPYSSSTRAAPLIPQATAIAPLEPGIAIALQQSSFEELADHGVWSVSGINGCHLALPTIEAIFKAKMADTHVQRFGLASSSSSLLGPSGGPSDRLSESACASERLMRFVEVVAKNCKGMYFDMSGLGLGKTSLELVVDALIADHSRETQIVNALIAAEEEDRRRRQATNQQQSKVTMGLSGNSAGSAVSLRRSTAPIGAKRPTFVGVPSQQQQQQQSPVSAVHHGGGGTTEASGSSDSVYSAHFEFPTYAVVDLSCNYPGECTGEAIAKLLRENQSIVALSLRSMGIANNPSTCAMLYTLAYHNNTLTTLDLSGIAGNPRNNLAGESGMALGNMLRLNDVLAILRLRDCGLDANALSNIFISAMLHVALSELDVSGNRMDKQAPCTALAALLAYGSCRLDKLVLESCQISDTALKVISKGLSQELHSSNADDATQNEAVALQRLHPLFGHQAESPHGEGSGSSLSNNASFAFGSSGSRLQTPMSAGRGGALPNNRVGPMSPVSPQQQEDGLFLHPRYIPAIPASGSLRHLFLGCNAFGVEGVAALATRLARIPRLETLSLNDNKLMERAHDSEGMRQPKSIHGLDSLLLALGETVPSLKELNLTNCSMLAMPTRIDFFLCRAPSLQILKLSKNNFGDFGARMLGEGLFQRAYAIKARLLASARSATDIVVSSPSSASLGEGAAQLRKETSGAASSAPTLQPLASASIGRTPPLGPSSSTAIDIHGEPLQLLDITDCGVTAAGMGIFLQHLARAPRTQVTETGIILGFRPSTITPHDGAGLHHVSANNASTDQQPAVTASAAAQNSTISSGGESSSAAANTNHGGTLVPISATPLAPYVPTESSLAFGSSLSQSPHLRSLSSFSSAPTSSTISLRYVPRSLLTTEIVVPSGYHGIAVSALKLMQPSWTRWDTHLVDLLCQTPSLESTDLGKYASEQLLKGLRDHKMKRIANAVPQYRQQAELVRREENRLLEAKDQIQDEVKRTERAKEAYKSMRDRQKAILNAMKNDIISTTDEVEKQNETLDAVNAQVNQMEIFNREKTEAMSVELSRFQRRTETVTNMRRDLEAQIKILVTRQRKQADLILSAKTQLASGVLVLKKSSSDPSELYPTISLSPSAAASLGTGGQRGSVPKRSPSLLTSQQQQRSSNSFRSTAVDFVVTPSSSSPTGGCESEANVGSTSITILPATIDPLVNPSLIIAAQTVGLQPIDLHIIALEADLGELEEERDHERGAAEYFKKKLEDIHKRIALLEGSDKGASGKGVKKRANSEVSQKTVPSTGNSTKTDESKSKEKGKAKKTGKSVVAKA